MKSTILFAVVACSLFCKAQTPATDPHWELYMNEEFNTYTDVTELSARWNSPVYPLERSGLAYLYRTQDDYEYSPYLYYHAYETSFADHHNYGLEPGDGDGSFCIYPKFEPTPYYANIVKEYGTSTTPTTYQDAYFTMTSGSISSKEQLMCGYFETRMKLPYYAPYDQQYTYYGTYPSFWLYSEHKNSEGQKINQSELDIYEIINGRTPLTGSDDVPTNSSQITTNVHCWDESQLGSPDNNYSDERKEIDPEGNNKSIHYTDRIINYSGDGWHTFAVEWNLEYVIFYIDGQQVRKSTRYINLMAPMGIVMEITMPAGVLKKYDPTGNNNLHHIGSGPINIPYPSTSMSFNNPNNLPTLPSNLQGSTSSGGSLYNNPGPNLDPNFKHEIDYIKIYKLKTNCDESVNISNSNFSSYVQNVKKDIVFSNTNLVSAGQDLQFRASDFVLINGGFTVNQGAQFSATAHGCPETPAKYICNLTPYINCGFNPDSYDNTIKSFIDINGNGCGSTLQNGQSIILRAKDYINLKEVDSKYFSDLTLKIEECP